MYFSAINVKEEKQERKDYYRIHAYYTSVIRNEELVNNYYAFARVFKTSHLSRFEVRSGSETRKARERWYHFEAE